MKITFFLIFFFTDKTTEAIDKLHADAYSFTILLQFLKRILFKKNLVDRLNVLSPYWKLPTQSFCLPGPDRQI